MEEKRYHYSKSGEGMAENSGLHDALGELETDITQELDSNNRRPRETSPVQELAEETIASEFFQGLEDAEQREVIRAINRFAGREVDTLSWLVEGERGDDNLLDLPAAESTPRAIPEDLITLIGASALDLFGTEQKSWLENWQENGFRGELDAAIFATAAAMDNMDRYREKPGGYFGYSVSHNTYRNVLVSATFDGSFRMEQYDTHPHGTTTPIGRKVEFAPNGEKKSADSYHSTEPLIATRTLEHLYRTRDSKKEINSLLETVNEQIRKDNSQAEMGNFGDYGDGDTRIVVDMLQRTKKQWRDGTMNTGEDNPVLEQLMIYPGNYNVSLRIVSFPEHLRFAQTNYTVRGELIDEYIDIPDEHLADFLAALHRQTKSGAGRTSPDAIETLLDKARC